MGTHSFLLEGSSLVHSWLWHRRMHHNIEQSTSGNQFKCSILYKSWIWTHLAICIAQYFVNSLRPSDAYMRQQPRTSLVQIMVCHLFGAKPLSKPMLEYCQLNPWEQTSVKIYHCNFFVLIGYDRGLNMLDNFEAISMLLPSIFKYRQVSNISGTLVGN